MELSKVNPHGITGHIGQPTTEYDGQDAAKFRADMLSVGVNHLSDDGLELYALGRTGQEETVMADAHLSKCPFYRHRFQDTKEYVSIIGAASLTAKTPRG